MDFNTSVLAILAHFEQETPYNNLFKRQVDDHKLRHSVADKHIKQYARVKKTLKRNYPTRKAKRSLPLNKPRALAGLCRIQKNYDVARRAAIAGGLSLDREPLRQSRQLYSLLY